MRPRKKLTVAYLFEGLYLGAGCKFFNNFCRLWRQMTSGMIMHQSIFILEKFFFALVRHEISKMSNSVKTSHFWYHFAPLDTLNTNSFTKLFFFNCPWSYRLRTKVTSLWKMAEVTSSWAIAPTTVRTPKPVRKTDFCKRIRVQLVIHLEVPTRVRSDS